ncbi:hypothetical protein BD779DRAFT_1787289 [Infundibulicybe gibba]|nr:hypothetical protein BD779DRAFT_1787289 [Infundibulicybe gibba]
MFRWGKSELRRFVPKTDHAAAGPGRIVVLRFEIGQVIVSAASDRLTGDTKSKLSGVPEGARVGQERQKRQKVEESDAREGRRQYIQPEKRRVKQNESTKVRNQNHSGCTKTRIRCTRISKSAHKRLGYILLHKVVFLVLELSNIDIFSGSVMGGMISVVAISTRGRIEVGHPLIQVHIMSDPTSRQLGPADMSLGSNFTATLQHPRVLDDKTSLDGENRDAGRFVFGVRRWEGPIDSIILDWRNVVGSSTRDSVACTRARSDDWNSFLRVSRGAKGETGLDPFHFHINFAPGGWSRLELDGGDWTSECYVHPEVPDLDRSIVTGSIAGKRLGAIITNLQNLRHKVNQLGIAMFISNANARAIAYNS